MNAKEISNISYEPNHESGIRTEHTQKILLFMVWRVVKLSNSLDEVIALNLALRVGVIQVVNEGIICA